MHVVDVNFIAQDNSSCTKLDESIHRLWDFETLGIGQEDEVHESLKDSIDIFVIKRRGGYFACANWKSRTNISCSHRLIASIAQSRYLKAFYKLGLLLMIWIKAV